MSSNYPGDFDTFPSPTASTKTNDASFKHADAHTNLGDAIEAIQATLGVNPQGAYSTMVERLDATQAIAVNTTTGQVSVGGYEIGDTGRRNVSSGLTTGWSVSGVFQLRRCGNVVEILMRDIDYSSGGSSTMYTLPTGFRPDTSIGFLAVERTTAGTAATISNGLIGSAGAITMPTGSDNYVATVTFTTTDAWPSSLPGSAA